MTKILKANEFINEQYITEMGMKVRNRNIASEFDSLIKKYNLVYNEVTDRYDCNGDVDVDKDLVNTVNGKLKIKFGVVKGDFSCADNKLKTLEGAPIEVGGVFDCSNNQLKTLEGCPTEVDDDFYCSDNQLTTLVGCPTKIGGHFDCSNNQLTTLNGCPNEINGDFACHDNRLTTLEGCPIKVGGEFYCMNNQLTSLEGCPTEVDGGFFCQGNDFIYDEEHFYSFLPDVIKGNVNFGKKCDYELAKQYYDVK